MSVLIGPRPAFTCAECGYTTSDPDRVAMNYCARCMRATTPVDIQRFRRSREASGPLAARDLLYVLRVDDTRADRFVRYRIYKGMTERMIDEAYLAAVSELLWLDLPMCVVPGCVDRGTETLIARETGWLAGREWSNGDEIALCRWHVWDVLHSTGEYEVVQLPQWMQADAELDAPRWARSPIDTLELRHRHLLRVVVRKVAASYARRHDVRVPEVQQVIESPDGRPTGLLRLLSRVDWSAVRIWLDRTWHIVAAAGVAGLRATVNATADGARWTTTRASNGYHRGRAAGVAARHAWRVAGDDLKADAMASRVGARHAATADVPNVGGRVGVDAVTDRAQVDSHPHR